MVFISKVNNCMFRPKNPSSGYHNYNFAQRVSCSKSVIYMSICLGRSFPYIARLIFTPVANNRCNNNLNTAELHISGLWLCRSEYNLNTTELHISGLLLCRSEYNLNTTELHISGLWLCRSEHNLNTAELHISGLWLCRSEYNLNTAELHISGLWLCRSPIIRICLPLSVNLFLL